MQYKCAQASASFVYCGRSVSPKAVYFCLRSFIQFSRIVCPDYRNIFLINIFEVSELHNIYLQLPIRDYRDLLYVNNYIEVKLEEKPPTLVQMNGIVQGPTQHEDETSMSQILYQCRMVIANPFTGSTFLLQQLLSVPLASFIHSLTSQTPPLSSYLPVFLYSL